MLALDPKQQPDPGPHSSPMWIRRPPEEVTLDIDKIVKTRTMKKFAMPRNFSSSTVELPENAPK
jgi:hypothetical protein